MNAVSALMQNLIFLTLLRGSDEFYRSVAHFDRSEVPCFHFKAILPCWVQTNELTKESLMKATVTLLATILISQLGQAHSLTEGSYSGNGLWHSTQSTGTYKTVSVVEKNEIKTRYQLPDGSVKEWDFQIKELTNGFFEISNKGTQLGWVLFRKSTSLSLSVFSWTIET